MAGTEINLYGVGDVSLTALMNTVDLQRVTYQGLSLTNYDNTALPAIAAGSLCEVGGTLFSFGVELAITGWAGVAVGVAYIKLVPAGATPDTVTAEFTDTAPTWSDAKQGWYGTVASANHRYIATLVKIDAATYAAKNLYNGRYGEKPLQSRMRVTKDDAQAIANGITTIVQYDDVEFDNLGEYTVGATWRYTAKEPGYRLVTASLAAAQADWANAEYWQIGLHKNAAVVSIFTTMVNNASVGVILQSQLTNIIYLAATDYIDIRVTHTQGGALNTNTVVHYNFFAVHRLS